MPINPPNIITVIRLLLVPIFVIYVQKKFFLPALIIFAAAGISDGLDGLLARYLNQRTRFGAYLDPLADKFLLISAYVSLAVLGFIPVWLTVIVISRDILILLGIAIYSIYGIEVEIRPSIVSKFNTVAQLLTVVWVLLGQILPETPWLGDASVFYWITAVLTTISGLHYIYVGFNVPETEKKE